jgi:hypothetical protein
MSMLSMSLHAHVPPSKRAATHKGVFARFCQRLYEARMHKAADVLKQHSHLLPAEMRRAALELSARNEASLPFIR